MNRSYDDIPKHVAIIMDGNGRWAHARGLPRTAGHKKGADVTKKIVSAASDLGIKYLTLFGFSSENWNRPDQEVQDLMQLLRYYLRAETADMHKNNVRLRVIGQRKRFDEDIIQLIENAEQLTKNNTGITVIIALNYGGRKEILQAAQSLLKDYKEEKLELSDIENLSEEQFSKYLMTEDIPDPDLLVRTSGEQRISNFLLWQCAYAEMIFTPVLWPDFNKQELQKAIEEYSMRERRFGELKTKAQRS